jgi:hypothetical protein
MLWTEESRQIPNATLAEEVCDVPEIMIDGCLIADETDARPAQSRLPFSQQTLHAQLNLFFRPAKMFREHSSILSPNSLLLTRKARSRRSRSRPRL